MAQATPYLMYEDAATAMDFLARAFGFRDVVRSLAPDDGRVWHAEMELDGATIYLGQPGGDFRNPRHAGGPTVGIHVYVDDVDAHYERAKEAGAEIRAELDLRDYGDRRYQAVDREGHVWTFATRVTTGSPEWQATLAGASKPA
jgi:PhnB protein